MNGNSDELAPLRLAPDMASLRLLVLSFVRNYIGKWDASPSLGEIANSMTPPSNRKRIHKAIRSLVAEGLLLRTPGPRGLRLPTERDAALRALRALGWTFNEAYMEARPPIPASARAEGVTDQPLLPPAELDYHPGDGITAEGGF